MVLKQKISNAELRNSSLISLDLKKNEYSGLITHIERLYSSNNKLNYLLAFSTLEIENTKYISNSKNKFIFNLLYKDK